MQTNSDAPMVTYSMEHVIRQYDTLVGTLAEVQTLRGSYSAALRRIAELEAELAALKPAAPDGPAQEGN